MWAAGSLCVSLGCGWGHKTQTVSSVKSLGHGHGFLELEMCPESPVAAQTLLPPAAPCPGPQLKPPACHQPAVPAFPAHTELSGASAPPSSDPKLRPVFQESSPQAPAFPSRQPLAGPPDVT